MRKSCLFILLTCSIILNAAERAVVLKAGPRFQFAPGYIRLTLTIEPDPRNRAYCITWFGSNDGETCRQLDADSPRTQPIIELKDLPAGPYAAVAKVERNDGSVVGSAAVEWEILESVPQG